MALEELSAPALAQSGMMSPVFDLNLESVVALMQHRMVLKIPVDLVCF